jgi:asparagine synthetase B (glutamine-hydrolysing)
MCGIYLSVMRDPRCDRCLGKTPLHPNDANLLNLKRRGPTVCKQISLDVESSQISLHASVLQMRQDLVPQPVRINTSHNKNNPHTYYLCWNGEVYEAKNTETAGNFATSDTRLVANRLAEKLTGILDQHAIAEVLKDLYNAEYAFLILRSDGQIFYGRDPWGRRSLLLRRSECIDCQSFIIASVALSMLPQTQTQPILLDSHDDHHDSDVVGTTGSTSWEEITPGHVHFISASGDPMTLPSVPIPTVAIPLEEQNDVNGMAQSLLEAPSGVSADLWDASLQLQTILSKAVERRMEHHETAVLFSGGLDSAVVAAMAARHCKERLYLYNVSFGPTYEKSADRQAALVTHRTLQDQYPEKSIIFQDIVVTWEDICDNEPHIRTILQPKATVMDVNIATALWFASAGGNKPAADSDHNESMPRVLLLGMGADELLGGYGRHRKAFDRGGWDDLQTELNMDQGRFWERNLGRDDRIVADHGREARFPFLDIRVTDFIHSLPLSLICDFSLPPGQGDKRILRLVAARLGIEYAGGLVKRAIQFGSRISHLSDAKRFGSRRKANGEASINIPR